jgi:hypothetical protein
MAPNDVTRRLLERLSLSRTVCVYTHTRCSHLPRAAESYTRALRRRLKPQAINHLGRFFGAPRLILPAARGARIRRGPFACELGSLARTLCLSSCHLRACMCVCVCTRTSSVCMCVLADLIGETAYRFLALRKQKTSMKLSFALRSR